MPRLRGGLWAVGVAADAVYVGGVSQCAGCGWDAVRVLALGAALVDGGGRGVEVEA